ncbi:hypothetical protein B566_EDAN001493 [Ephemera danica]|nr:hypothetical protein B566_EDAN001493 [Ephemera danica]
MENPILGVAEYRQDEYFDGSMVPVCFTRADSFWPVLFFVSSIALFFVIPLAVLIILYSVIARHLTTNPGLTKAAGGRKWGGGPPPRGSGHVLRYRRQVVLIRNGNGTSGYGDSLLIGRTGTLTNTTSTSCSTSGHQRSSSTSTSEAPGSSWRRNQIKTAQPSASITGNGNCTDAGHSKAQSRRRVSGWLVGWLAASPTSAVWESLHCSSPLSSATGRTQHKPSRRDATVLEDEATNIGNRNKLTRFFRHEY